MLNWSFGTAEGVLFAAVDSVRPAVKIIEGPLQRIDQMLCNSLDVVEQRVPSVYLPPQLVSLSFVSLCFFPFSSCFFFRIRSCYIR